MVNYDFKNCFPYTEPDTNEKRKIREKLTTDLGLCDFIWLICMEVAINAKEKKRIFKITKKNVDKVISWFADETTKEIAKELVPYLIGAEFVY